MRCKNQDTVSKQKRQRSTINVLNEDRMRFIVDKRSFIDIKKEIV